MNNFIYHNPTKLAFGKGQIARLPKLIPAGKRIMLTFGGGSVKRNGVYDQVVAAPRRPRSGRVLGASRRIVGRDPARSHCAGQRAEGGLSCWLSAAGRSSTVRNSSLRAFYDGDAWDIVLKGQAGKTVPLVGPHHVGHGFRR